MKTNLHLNKEFVFLFLILVLLFSSCNRTMPCKNCNLIEKNNDFTIRNVPFLDTKSVLYRVSIRLYNLYFSGLLAVKKTDDDKFRMSLISETGFKLFDMEINEKNTEITNVFSELDREEVIKTFKEDFTLMVLSGLQQKNCNKYSYINHNEVLIECPLEKKMSINYLVNNDDGTLKKIWKAEKIKYQYLEINYGYDEKYLLTPVFITIVHSNVKLRMEFSILEQSDVQK